MKTQSATVSHAPTSGTGVEALGPGDLPLSQGRGALAMRRS